MTFLHPVLFLVSLVLQAAAVPQGVSDLWADFDPRKDPLEVEVIREWKEDGAVFRHVRYLIGTGKAPFNTCEKSKPNDSNADWGAVDSSRPNVQGYSTLLPGLKVRQKLV